jgi:disulfide bond formation protein DsbB
LSKTESFWSQYSPFLAFAVALTALLGSLYFEAIGFAPCVLCWYQRILMYPLALILLVGMLKRDQGVFDYVLPFSVLGMGVSSYHYLIQMGVINHPALCSVGVPCNLRDPIYFGFVTIPLMTLVAFAFITLVMALGKWAGNGARADAPAADEPTE